MAINYKPFDGKAKATEYPFVYPGHAKAIKEVAYDVSKGGKVVTCFITLSNGLIVSGVHEQHHDINEEVFKQLAYQQAIDRAEQHGYFLDTNPVIAEEGEAPEEGSP